MLVNRQGVISYRVTETDGAVLGILLDKYPDENDYNRRDGHHQRRGAAGALLGALREPAAHTPRRETVPTTLVVRRSCGAALS
jgi:hypothetical protein